MPFWMINYAKRVAAIVVATVAIVIPPPSGAIMIFPIPAIYFARRSPPVFIQHCALLRIGSKFLLRISKSVCAQKLTSAAPCSSIEMFRSDSKR